jgi:predicted RNA-binding protein with PIN domain
MFLIDGYNLLHAMAPGRSTPAARDRLLGILVDWCGRENYRARIIFDPTRDLRRRETRGAVEIRSVAQGGTADGEILETLASTKDRTAYTLVSNDRRLVDAATRRGFKVVACRDFADRLMPAEQPQDPPRGSVDYWLRVFGLEDENDG